MTRAGASAADAELWLLIDGVRRRWGYDLDALRAPVVRAAVRRLLREAPFDGPTSLCASVFQERAWFDRLLADCLRATARGPAQAAWWATARAEITPWLRTWPRVRAWAPGYPTPALVWSLLHALHEADLLARTRLFALPPGDPHALVVPRAECARVRRASDAAGGGADPHDSLVRRRDAWLLRPALADALVPSRHVLGVDGPFHEFHLVVSSGVTRGFSGRRRADVFALFRDSLAHCGLLWLSDGETLPASLAGDFSRVEAPTPLFRRRR